MTRRRRADSQHLADALDHLRVLQQHLGRGGLADVMIRDAVCHRLEVAVEAVGRVDPELVRSEFGDDWPRIVAMRNMLAHQYAELDQEILQNTVDNRLDPFVASVQRMLNAAVERETAR